MASHHSTNAVTEGDHSVRVLGHQLFIQPTSNLVPPRALSLRGGVGFVRSSHLAPHCPDCNLEAKTNLVDGGLVRPAFSAR